ncbi:hypothetical protein [Legionella sp. km772]|uniref:hypothetical protein n=1 Tax=Legionella sp. km772 TaxID=2498111 RepID=UPI001F263DBD|nr:hypothetical protein [Legionella sp. km772]
MVLEKNLEMFIEFKGKSSTYKVYGEGELLGVSVSSSHLTQHQPADILQISSGARNAFLLCPIADARPHHSIEKYFNRQIPKPEDLGEHYNTFKELCNASGCKWRSKLLVFPMELARQIKENKLPKISNLIKEYDSKQIEYYANTPFYNYLMTYIKANNDQISQNIFVNDVLKQLIDIGVGQLPGYGLAVDNNLIPVDFISEVYRDIYKSKYTPLIMVPTHFDKGRNNPIFYSILKEEMAFRPSSFSNKPQRCELIYNTYHQYAEEIKKLGISKNTHFYEAATNLDLTLFNEKKVQVPPNLFKIPKDCIFDYDPRFLAISERLGYARSLFPSKTTFLIGCFGIKINEH